MNSAAISYTILDLYTGKTSLAPLETKLTECMARLAAEAARLAAAKK